jgi:uncharacterized protein YaaR (DUF327 family)
MVCSRKNQAGESAMRIKDASSPGLTQKDSKSTSQLKKGLGSFFSAELSSRQSDLDNYEQEVDALRHEIESVGDKLAQEPTLPNFKRFRDLLSQLAKRISTEAYHLEKIGGTPQNPRTFEIITVINAEADRLYNLIIQKQRDNMAITAKVIGIKGLVVDLIT